MFLICVKNFDKIIDCSDHCSVRSTNELTFFLLRGNQKVKSIIVTEVTVMKPFIMYSSQNPWNFLDMEVIMMKKDDKCLSTFQIKSIRVTFLQ